MSVDVYRRIWQCKFYVVGGPDIGGKDGGVNRIGVRVGKRSQGNQKLHQLISTMGEMTHLGINENHYTPSTTAQFPNPNLFT
jgi:hypothetical protein